MIEISVVQNKHEIKKIRCIQEDQELEPVNDNLTAFMVQKYQPFILLVEYDEEEFKFEDILDYYSWQKCYKIILPNEWTSKFKDNEKFSHGMNEMIDRVVKSVKECANKEIKMAISQELATLDPVMQQIREGFISVNEYKEPVAKVLEDLCSLKDDTNQAKDQICHIHNQVKDLHERFLDSLNDFSDNLYDMKKKSEIVREGIERVKKNVNKIYIIVTSLLWALVVIIPGFVLYKSITNDISSEGEILYDQPEIDKTKVRVSGPFTVESLPAPIVKPINELESLAEETKNKDLTRKQADWREELRRTGIVTHGKDRIKFSNIQPLSDLTFFQAEGETTDGKRAIICFGSEDKVMDARYVNNALQEVSHVFPKPEYVIFAAFQFGPEAMAMISEAKYPGIKIFEILMNADLMTKDLKKKQTSSQSFLLVGQPDVTLVKHGTKKNCYKVIVNGFDYFNTKTGEIMSGGVNDIAMWMLDIDYDGLCVEPEQIFFPMGGSKGGWNKLAKTLKAEIDQDKIEKFAGNESLWFEAKVNESIAVKIIDNRGVESMVVLKVGE